MNDADPKTGRLRLLGLPLDAQNLTQAADQIEGWIVARHPRTVVTLNPEILVQSDTDTKLKQSIEKADLVTPDGIGILWAAKTLLRKRLPERVSGIDLTVRLLERGGRNLRVFYLGGKPGVADRAAQRMLARYGTISVGTQHGYFSDTEAKAIAQAIRFAQPHLLLTALGAGRQECFNEQFRAEMQVPVSMGVGGTLDVLAGMVARAPQWTSRLGMEWAWRILTGKRWGRFPRLFRFVSKVRRAKRLKR